MPNYQYSKLYVSSDVLAQTINDNVSMSQNVSYINWSADGILEIFFENDLTADEQAVLQTIVDNHQGGNDQFYRQVYYIKTYSASKLTKETWYEIDNGDGTYSGKAREIVYTWSGNTLTHETETVYCTNGAIWSQTTSKYYTGSNNTIIKKPA